MPRETPTYCKPCGGRGYRTREWEPYECPDCKGTGRAPPLPPAADGGGTRQDDVIREMLDEALSCEECWHDNGKCSRADIEAYREKHARAIAEYDRLRAVRPVEGEDAERWCVIFKRDTDPIDYTEGEPADMLARYERLAAGWTGVVLCKILVPDAASAPMGESRARFNALRAARAPQSARPTPETDQ